MEGHEENGVNIIVKRVEIDTSAPFRSVKEAVALFGERVLAGEIRNESNKTKQDTSHVESIMAELGEAQHDLEKEREENLRMADCVIKLQQELEQTKMELKQLQKREHSSKRAVEVEIEDLKFVENAMSYEVEIEKPAISQELEFQKKRYVSFADAPSLSRVLSVDNGVLERQFPMEKESTPSKKKKKTLVPFIRALFIKKKGPPYKA
ncbi:WEB family protein [Ananas comosus]|uniref:WEB family protein n=1 Tax=Ananas comosus TaxID=4615 RepID=A0A199VC15_ANACO|nr:WEB family protein [Ananas comosus]